MHITLYAIAATASSKVKLDSTMANTDDAHWTFKQYDTAEQGEW